MKTNPSDLRLIDERDYIKSLVLTGVVLLCVALIIAVSVTWFTTRAYEAHIHAQAMRTATLLPLVIVPTCVLIIGRQGLLNHRRMMEVTRLAHTDEMTGLANRRAFMQDAYARLKAANLDLEGVCIFIIDLDHFKRVNDIYGHDAGDRVLIHTSQQIVSCLPEASLAARLGGEEFAVLIDFRTIEEVHELAEAIRERIATTPCRLDHQLIEVTASLGAGIAPPRDNVRSVLTRADNALYDAKNQGRNRFRVAA